MKILCANLNEINDGGNGSRAFICPHSGKCELLELERAVENLLSGQCGTYVVDGEPGVGKTRLAREFAARVSMRKVPVLWETCDGPLGDKPRLWPSLRIVLQQCLNGSSRMNH
jgi:hypothetical protein